jgi:hypothetical protein
MAPVLFGHLGCILIPFLSQPLSDPMGIAILGFLTDVAVPRWLLPTSILHVREAGPIPLYLRAENLQMTFGSNLSCRLHA